MKTKTANESSRRARKHNKSISKKRWLTYAAAGAATVVAGQQGAETADAAIRYTNPEPDIVLIGNSSVNSLYFMDMDGDGSDEFVPRQVTFPAANSEGAANLFAFLGDGFVGFSAGGFLYPSNLPAGVNVSTQPIIVNTSVSTIRGDLVWRLGYPQSQWFSAAGGDQTGYLGLTFDSAVGQHYGWMRITVSNYPQNILTLHDWAYNDEADRAILTGQVPEPGSLGLLALGGAGLLAWRRRRAEAA